MDKIVKIIVNALRCPICKSQIDGHDMYYPNIRSTSFNFHCVSNYHDYRFWMPYDGYSVPKILYDMVDVYDGHYLYRIDQKYDINETIIDVWGVDVEHNMINEQSKIFTYQQILFDYQNTDRNKIVNRLKTVLTFQ